MSFKTQRLVNRFPLWTKVRKDPSSLGSRLLETFAEGLEENSITVKRLTEDLILGKRDLLNSFLYEIILDEADLLEPQQGANGYSWSYPNIVGTVGSDEFEIERSETLTDLLMALPTRASVLSVRESADRLIWNSSNPFDYQVYPYVERLWIVVSDSTFYVNKTPHQDRDKSGLTCIRITGIDYDYNQFSETINIVDDGVFISKFAFREVTEITLEGFNGDVIVSAGPYSSPYELDPFRTAVLDDLEGPLKLYLEDNYIMYRTDRFKLGRQYRRQGVESVDNQIDICTSILLDNTGDTYDVLSIAVCPSNAYLYALGLNGQVYIYEHNLPEFIAPSSLETTSSYLEIQAISPYAKYNNTEYLWTKVQRIREPIAYIQIKRIAPDATVTYLQADKMTWSSGAARITSDAWRDFRFSTEYDQIGLWEYVCTVQAKTTITVTTTTVACASLTAIGIIQVDENATLIYFDDVGHLTTDSGTEIFTYQMFRDKYIIDERAGRIWLSDTYDFVSIE